MNPDPANTIFQKAVAFVNHTGKHLFLTGKAGTGKTTFLKYIKENSFKKMAIVAPTGVAAINAGGVTIHSFFQLPFGPFIPGESAVRERYSGEVNNRFSLLSNLKLQGAKRQVIRELDLLVIDEISMVRADLLDAIDVVLRHVRQQPLVPFGGVQMVYIGDLFQLPPVARQEEWELLQDHYKSPFFFEAQVLQLVPPIVIELKKIYRQKDDLFISLLNNVRNNCCTNADLDLLQKYYDPTFSPAKEDNFITLTSHNNKADSINQRELEKLPGKLYTFQAQISGEFYERSYPAEKALQLKKGAQIMFIKNDKGENRRFYNGKIGTVKQIEREKIVVTFPNEPDELELEQETWENIRYNYSSENDSLEEEELGQFTQYPIRLAWAITIHKSQGLTFEKAVIDAGASFAPGQVYVSLSRLTSLRGLVLHSRISRDCISTDNRVVAFVKSEMNEDEMQQTLDREQRVFLCQSLLRSFSWQKITEAVAAHYDTYESRHIPEKEACIAWAGALNKTVQNLNNVADKFIQLLNFLFVDSEADGYKKLYERTTAATNYFVAAIEQDISPSITQHITEVKVRQKVKRYIKELQQLSLLFSRKKEQLQQALQLAEGLHKAVALPALLQLVAQNKKTDTVQLPKEDSADKSAKLAKGESARATLQLFKKEKTIADIAVERGFSQSTVEGHLAGFVKTGEVDILDLVEKEVLEKIMKGIQSGATDYSIVKAKAGSGVSYGVIKAAFNYWEKIKADEIKQ